MGSFLGLGALVCVLFLPPYLLSSIEVRLGWRMRYGLSILPAAYTGLGWRLADFFYGPAGCDGGLKNLHDCIVFGIDLTALIGYGFFLMIPFTFVALPLTLWLLLNTGAKHIGERRRRNAATREIH